MHKSQGWPREPEFSGFFTDYERLPRTARKIVDLTTGATLRYSVTLNRWDERSPRLRGIRAVATLPGERKPACWLRYDLIEDGGTYQTDDDFWYVCDALSGQLERLATGLIESCGSEIGDVLCQGPILHFERLEVKQELRGTGLGVALAQRLLLELVERFNPVLLVLCPYPLQFENCHTEREVSAREQASYKRAFDSSRQRLARLYERGFGVKRLHKGSDYWGTGLSGCHLMQGRDGWVLW